MAMNEVERTAWMAAWQHVAWPGLRAFEVFPTSLTPLRLVLHAHLRSRPTEEARATAVNLREDCSTSRPA